MKDFTLPLGTFQIHFVASPVADAVPPLKEALQEHDAILDAAYAENPEASPLEAFTNRAEEFETSIEKIKKASEKFQQALKISEFPAVLPRITEQLIFASIVAQAFNLSFEVIDYERKDDDKGRSSWWVTGHIIDKHNRINERPGTSFMYDKNNDKMAEGALLSACADAFIHCVFAAVPHFPWDRWDDIISIEDTSPNSG